MKPTRRRAPAGRKSRHDCGGSRERAAYHHPEAEVDLADAKAWYERKRAGLGERFILCVEAAFEHIRRVPGAATEVYAGVRRVKVRDFPYSVFYRTDPDQVVVIAVYHNARDPRGWQARLD